LAARAFPSSGCYLKFKVIEPVPKLNQLWNWLPEKWPSVRFFIEIQGICPKITTF
jgi:hypothetical protein